MQHSVDTRVSPSLHPGVLEAVDGYNEVTAPYVSQLLTAFDAAYQGLGQIHAAREAYRNNPTLNDAAKLFSTAEVASKRYSSIVRGFDSAMANVKKSIDQLNAELDAPLVSRASTALSAEIRGHVKAMNLTERNQFLTEALQSKDYGTLEAVLGAPAYLTGMSNEERIVRTRAFHSDKDPAKLARVQVMQRAYTLTMERSMLLHREVEKAMGASWDDVNNLRNAKAISEHALRAAMEGLK
jgi:hypothetical protein